MALMLNYVMRYGASLQDLLIAKLTAFYNKLILKEKSRLIIMLPIHMKVHEVDRHKVTFDEVTVAKFDPADGQFWDTHKLVNYMYFLSSFSLQMDNLYIDHGKVFAPPIEVPEDKEDIMVAGFFESANLKYIKQNLVTIGYDVPNDFPLYDFSGLLISDKARMPLHMELKKVVNKYPEYVDQEACYVVLSYLVHVVAAEHDLTIGQVGKKAVDISECPMIEDFYVLL